MRVRDQLILNKIQDVLANASEFSFNGLLVVFDFLNIFIISLDVLLLLDGGEHTPGGTTCSYNVFEGHGKDVSFLKGELLGSRLCKLS